MYLQEGVQVKTMWLSEGKCCGPGCECQGCTNLPIEVAEDSGNEQVYGQLHDSSDIQPLTLLQFAVKRGSGCGDVQNVPNGVVRLLQKSHGSH